MSLHDSRALATSAASTTSGVALALVYVGDCIRYASDNAPDISDAIEGVKLEVGDVAHALFGLGDAIDRSRS